jgi:hypothetical protein
MATGLETLGWTHWCLKCVDNDSIDPVNDLGYRVNEALENNPSLHDYISRKLIEKRTKESHHEKNVRKLSTLLLNQDQYKKNTTTEKIPPPTTTQEPKSKSTIVTKSVGEKRTAKIQVTEASHSKKTVLVFCKPTCKRIEATDLKSYLKPGARLHGATCMKCHQQLTIKSFSGNQVSFCSKFDASDPRPKCSYVMCGPCKTAETLAENSNEDQRRSTRTSK